MFGILGEMNKISEAIKAAGKIVETNENNSKVYKAWENCIQKANQYYRNVKREVESGRDDPKTEKLGDEFQEANKVLADYICEEHRSLCNEWTYGERTRYRWNKEKEDIMQTSIAGFNISVKIIDFTMRDEFMIYYDNATFIYTLDGDKLQFRKVG